MFLSITLLEKAGIKNLSEGQKVSFDVGLKIKENLLQIILKFRINKFSNLPTNIITNTKKGDLSPRILITLTIL